MKIKLHAFMADDKLGGLTAESFRTHRVIARLLDGDSHRLNSADVALAQQLTQRTEFPRTPVRRFAFIAGRRSGKTELMAQCALHAASHDYSDRMAPGEVAVIACVAPDKKTATVLFERIRARVAASPYLSRQLSREVADTLEFSHGTTIEVHVASFRSTRGRTFAAVLIDEAAFLRSDESATPDVELVRAVTPGLATLNGLLVIVTSPYMRSGITWDWHRKHFGRNDSATLVVQGPTQLFNPTLDAGVIAAAKEDDPEAASSEWGGEFRSDLSAAFHPDWIDRATDGGTFERPPVGVLAEGRAPVYLAFTDPAGGSGKDAWATRIVHAEGDMVLDDALLELRPPFSTPDAARRVAEFLRSYGVSIVRGDRYAGRWPADALAAHGITYTESDLPKSDIYRECVPLLSGGRVRLLDHARTLTQLRMLERRVQPGGRDRFNHPGNSNDDCANALCGALLLASRANTGSDISAAIRAGAPLGAHSGVWDGLMDATDFSTAVGQCPPTANRW